MSSTYSTNLAIELIGTGDQAGTWGTTTNSNLGTLIEQSISGYVTQAVSTGTDTTITIPNGSSGVARNMYIELTGTGGANTNLIVPANKKLYFIFNNSSGAVTVKVSGQTGVSVPTGKKMVLVSNGTDIVNGLNYIADFASNSATITHLSATSATITNLTLTSLVISNLSIASANITTLTSASATITNLLATSLAVSSIATFSAGSAAAPSITTTGDTNTGLFFPAADTIAFTEGGVEAARFDSSGNLGIGTTTPAAKLNVNAGSAGLMSVFDSTDANGGYLLGRSSGTSVWDLGTAKQALNVGSATDFGINVRSGFMALGTGNTERMRLDSSGNLGLGVTPSAWSQFVAFEMGARGNSISSYNSGGVYVGSNCFFNGTNWIYKISSVAPAQYYAAEGLHAWQTAAAGTAGNAITFTQAMTLDANGDLTVGDTSANGRLKVKRSTDGIIGYFDGNTTQLKISVASSNIVLDAQNGNAVMAFQTNGSERVRITAAGAFIVGKTAASFGGTEGFFVANGDSSDVGYAAQGYLTRVSQLNRQGDDGNLVEFYQDGNSEGTISVSGSTVSYNGGHLSRWSQTADNTRISLLKGTVMSNLDQMAVWEKDGQPLPNEQLNCMKVSDVEGDVNVAGVFVNWDNDDDVYTNDMNVAMTGDMIIRIAQGVVVQRGELLMSAGDGTAKPQGDDIIRSKTVAKVTSNHVTCTYDDGSYCVPCVLMAC